MNRFAVRTEKRPKPARVANVPMSLRAVPSHDTGLARWHGD